MDIHKPKAAHSWREFLIEIGTIICGILIALGLEQIADALHWRHKVEQAEHSMRIELAEDDGPQAFARLATVVCFDNQLDRLELLSSPGSERRALRSAAITYNPPGRSWDQQAWQAAVASDVGTHMGAEELVRWSGPYRLMAGLDKGSAEESASVVALVAAAGTNGRLSEADSNLVRSLIGKLRGENQHHAGAGLVMLQALSQAGVDVSAADRREILSEARARFGACTRDPEVVLAKKGRVVNLKRQFETWNETRAYLGLRPIT